MRCICNKVSPSLGLAMEAPAAFAGVFIPVTFLYVNYHHPDLMLKWPETITGVSFHSTKYSKTKSNKSNITKSLSTF